MPKKSQPFKHEHGVPEHEVYAFFLRHPLVMKRLVQEHDVYRSALDKYCREGHRNKIELTRADKKFKSSVAVKIFLQLVAKDFKYLPSTISAQTPVNRFIVIYKKFTAKQIRPEAQKLLEYCRLYEHFINFKLRQKKLRGLPRHQEYLLSAYHVAFTFKLHHIKSQI
jgi:hypothetical protein